MKVMSPIAPAAEMAGMKAAVEFFLQRPQLTAQQVRNRGDWAYSYFILAGRADFGDGFRRMAYILSQVA